MRSAHVVKRDDNVEAYQGPGEVYSKLWGCSSSGIGSWLENTDKHHAMHLPSCYI
jgi:hypothetical protein